LLVAPIYWSGEQFELLQTNILKPNG
jgi:hypothetical protein